jgi:hypothetical protein
MKKFFKIMSSIIEAAGQARAATALAKLGKYKEARNIYK